MTTCKTYNQRQKKINKAKFVLKFSYNAIILIASIIIIFDFTTFYAYSNPVENTQEKNELDLIREKQWAEQRKIAEESWNNPIQF